ncbi:glycosyltransferase family 2 protein [Oryzobacter telluris]|uniref:glycosyltransferase family 2 protein n=1 Tax=Oryzobacter telluris TaxID=3149179 RepID=UPI00370D2A44
MTSPAAARVPDVSVVIPAFNAARTLPEQLECLARQEGAPAFEVVVSDNGSTDDTARVVAGWTDRLRIRLVDAGERRGAGFARNVGVQAAAADKVLFCDADDLVSRSWVAVMAAALEPRTLVAGPVLRITPETPAFGPVEEGLPYGNSDADFRYMGFLPCVLSGSLGIHRADFLALGGFDNSYAQGCEDVDFSWRAQLAGLTVGIAHGCALFYRPRDGALASFRAERGYTRTSILLWLRFRDQPGISGMSLSWSLRALLRTVVSVRPSVVRHPADRLRWAAAVGANLGSVQGHLAYRVFGSPPPRDLLPS